MYNTITKRPESEGNGMIKRVVTLLAMVVMAVPFGCSEPVDDISTVQPHYVSKALFTGEWAYKQTITDAAPEVALGFVGLEGSMEKIRWEITKGLLLAYRTHEAIPGLDEDSTLEGGEYQGDPVAAFAITKHFDIRRGYSATTGEQTNEIVENSSDRPWFEREYMRVDWGSGGSILGPVDIGLASYSQATDYVRETETFDPDQLQVTEDYIQITQMVTVSDGSMTCYYTFGNFNRGGEGRVRLSFPRSTRKEYAPREYKDLVEFRDEEGRHMRKLYLGVPLRPTEGKSSIVLRNSSNSSMVALMCDRITLSRIATRSITSSLDASILPFGAFSLRPPAWGGHDENKEFYAAIHNIWEDPFTYTDGSKNEKLLVDRKPKTIDYLNVGLPDDLLHIAGQMSDDWDGPYERGRCRKGSNRR